MSELSEDLRSFLDVVAKVSTAVAERSDDPSWVNGALAEAGLVELAQDTAEEPDSLGWLTHTVRVSAQASPSLAFALAARYAADRALGDRAAGTDSVFALAVAGSRPVVPTLLEPGTVVVLDTDEIILRATSWATLSGSATYDARSGLRAAGLATIQVPEVGDTLDGDAQDVLMDWDLLTGAAFAGITRRAVDVTNAYVMERHQFGVPIGSFAGLRALVAEMALRADAIESLLEHSTEDGSHSESVSAVAGRAAVDTCLDAIQAHGGYGYIDEYPVADLLRDALSLQARAGGRRLHVARVAERALGTPDRARA